MPAYAVIVSISWVVFWAYWILSAFSSKKGHYSIANRNFWLGSRIGIFLIILLVLRLPFAKSDISHYQQLFIPNEIWQVVGLVLFFIGLSLAIWARRHMGKNWGMPMSQKDNPELVTSGPYRFIRHPIYSGILLATLGSIATISFYWLLVFMVMGIYFTYAAVQEEKLMLKQFPETYPAYKNKTKMLIPFLL